MYYLIKLSIVFFLGYIYVLHCFFQCFNSNTGHFQGKLCSRSFDREYTIVEGRKNEDREHNFP